MVLQAIKSTSPQVLQAIKLMCLQHMHLTPGMVPRHGKDQHQTHQRVLPWRHQDHTQQQFGASGLRNNNLEGKVEEVESHECLQRMQSEQSRSMLFDLDVPVGALVFG